MATAVAARAARLLVTFASNRNDHRTLLAGVAEACPEVPVVARSHGTNGFHDQTLVVLAVG